jgi:hypothetical protein
LQTNTTLTWCSLQVLSRHAPHLTSLTSLCLTSNAISNAGFRMLASAAAPHLGRLKRLKLGANSCGDTGAAALATALPCWPGLQELQLQDNCSIGPEGAKALGRALGGAVSLQRLNLSRAGLGPEGGRQLAAGVRAQAAAAATAAGEWLLGRGEGAGLGSSSDSISSSSGGNPQPPFGLQQLELGGCKLRAEGVEALATAIAATYQQAAAAAADVDAVPDEEGDDQGAAVVAGQGSRQGLRGSSSGGWGRHQGERVLNQLTVLGLSKDSMGDKGVKVRQGAC